jgi:FKBP-type peptidyl-prolyl cis-trans isomerase FklB
MRITLLTSITGIILLASQAQATDQHQHKAPSISVTETRTTTSDESHIFKTAKEKASYAIGIDLIRNFKRQSIDADLEVVIRGMKDEKSGKKLLLTEADLKKTLSDYNLELKNKQALQKQLTADQNKRDGKAFFTANKNKPGVITLPDGIQYNVIKEGNGVKPTDTDSVTLRYKGTLLDGTEFDSTDFMGGYPVTFFVKDSLIDGWKAALKLMPAGSKWQIFVPPHLGYGEKGAGRDIGPNSTLIYEIELLAVNPQPAPPNKKE